VWFHPANNESHPDFTPASLCAAIIAFVHSDSVVNLAVFDGDGNAHSATSVPLIQDDGKAPDTGYWCEWMPYQKAVAAGDIPAVKHAVV
jgi:hypothetical protein